MTDTVGELPAGQCVCGRDIPDGSPSDWACGELCQSAWLMHQADPGYPHPREIRERVEQRAAAGRARTGVTVTLPAAVPDGTEISVDGTRFVRAGSRWEQQTGPWSQLRTELAEVLEYQRWCPHCRHRRSSLIEVDAGSPHGQVQRCRECDQPWAGRPLVGIVETRGDPWPSIRMRITDGYRSAAHVWTDDTITEMGERGRPVAEILSRYWLRLERALTDGYADQDEPTERQAANARRFSRTWNWAAVPVINDPAAIIRVTST